MSVRKPTRGEAFVFAWIIGALTLAAAIPAIGDLQPFLVPIALWSWLAIGVCLLAGLLIVRHFRAAGLLAILTPLAFFVAPVVSSTGADLWNQAQFDRSRNVYEDVIARASALPDTGVVQEKTYRIERGQTTRVAFPLPVSVADNWSAIVHDPSDLVATARGWGARPGDYTAHPDVRDLWGGKLVACSRITGHYFRCDFT
jgi:hypothetical protein